jgi:dienelactone hydrolase
MRFAILVMLMADVAQAQPAAESTARQAVEDLKSGKTKELIQRFDEHKAAKVSADQLAAAWKGLEARSGKLDACTEARVRPRGSEQAVYLLCKFERDNWMVEVDVDDKQKITGLIFKPAPWQPPPEKTATWEERVVHVGPEQLTGLLAMPTGKGKFPAVILVHGSGPNDGDETIGPNKPFKDLSNGLAAKGVAVLRYEKRTHAPGATIPERFTVADETVDDARAAIDLLATTPGIDAKRVFVAGHSLGGYLMPRIVKGTQAAGAILLAGAARPLEEMVVEQMRANHPLGLPAAEAMRKQVQDPNLKPDTMVSDPSGAKIPGSYFLDLRGYKPADELRAFKKPILVLQGGRDIQVRRADYDLFAKALAGRKDVTLKLYPMLMHLFIEGDGNLTDYSHAGHVSQDVIDDIAAFVGGKKRAK